MHPGNTPFAGVAAASGNVLANDGDPDPTDTVRVVGVTAGAAATASGHLGATLIGAYGDLVLAADGSWTYVLDNNAAATQALGQGAHGSDVPSIRSTARSVCTSPPTSSPGVTCPSSSVTSERPARSTT